MAGDARMTVRLDPATRRKVERLATKEGISMNEALNRLLLQAPDARDRAVPRARYELRPRAVGFGFDIAQTKRLAAEMSDERAAQKLKSRG